MNSFYPSIIKRLIDILLSLIALIILIPLSVIIIFVLAFEHKRFPLLMQSRGLTLTNGRVTIFKFRTLLEKEEPSYPDIKSENIFYKPFLQKFVPPFSGWLRKTGLDEMPQFLNVLTGKMSIVGPRPLSLRDLQIMKENYPEFYSKRESLTAKPGISGLWQIYGDRKKGMANLIEMDSLYERHYSFLTDMKIICISIYRVITAGNSDAIVNGHMRFFKRRNLNREY